MIDRGTPQFQDGTGRRWTSVLPYLYRYENQNHIDDFFDNGKLMLSCFSVYQKYADNQLGDSGEGHAMHVTQTENNMTIMGMTALGANCYSFCTSTMLDPSLLTTFSRNAVFKIVDPGNFIYEINKALETAGIRAVWYGNCLYVKDRIDFQKDAPSFNMEDLAIGDGSGNYDLNKFMAMSLKQQRIEQAFLKKLRYQPQNEYRILWVMDKLVTASNLISCPGAVQYCERIDLKNYEGAFS